MNVNSSILRDYDMLVLQFFVWARHLSGQKWPGQKNALCLKKRVIQINRPLRCMLESKMSYPSMYSSDSKLPPIFESSTSENN